MIDGDIVEFVDHIYYGDELVFEYKGQKYFLEGWTKDGICSMMLYVVDYQPFHGYMWEDHKKTMGECAENFLNAPLWDGKTFLEVEKEVTWSDWD